MLMARRLCTWGRGGGRGVFVGLDDHVDLRRRFDEWERDLSFFAVRVEPRVYGRYQRSAFSPEHRAELDRLGYQGVGDAVWGDDPSLRRPRMWFR
jgi:hypothetical protein